MIRRRALLAVLAAACAFEGCSGGRPPAGGGHPRPVIGVSLLNLSNEFIVMLNQAMQEKARVLGMDLIVNDAQRSADRQVEQVESFVAQKVDAIILNPCEVEASSPAVEKALAAGIPVVNVNSETRVAPTAFVGSRDEESGRIAMEYIAQRLGGKGNVVMMHGFMGQAAQIKRDQGAREVLARNPGLKLVAEQTAEWDRAKAMSLMENWIQSYGDAINAVFAQNDEMAMGALMALEQARQERQGRGGERGRYCRCATGGPRRTSGCYGVSGRQAAGCGRRRDRGCDRSQAAVPEGRHDPFPAGDEGERGAISQISRAPVRTTMQVMSSCWRVNPTNPSTDAMILLSTSAAVPPLIPARASIMRSSPNSCS